MLLIECHLLEIDTKEAIKKMVCLGWGQIEMMAEVAEEKKIDLYEGTARNAINPTTGPRTAYSLSYRLAGWSDLAIIRHLVGESMILGPDEYIPGIHSAGGERGKLPDKMITEDTHITLAKGVKCVLSDVKVLVAESLEKEMLTYASQLRQSRYCTLPPL